MHRWFFANEREECVPKPEQFVDKQEGQTEKDTQVKEEVHIKYTDFPFCVKAKFPLQGNEIIAISGNCDTLGNWDPMRLCLMEPAKCHCEKPCCCHKFTTTVRIPRDKDIEYRYCLVGHDPIANDVIIRFWEIMPKHRIIRTCQNTLRKCELFGKPDEGDEEPKVDRGWATTETYIQFKVFNAPFIWLQQSSRLLYVHLQPMYETDLIDCRVKILETLRLTTMAVVANHGSVPSIPNNMRLAFAEVANLRYAAKLHFQKQGGARCGPEDLQLFHCSIRYPEQTLYRVDLYTYAHKAGVDEPPYHYGYGFILPDQLINSEGRVRVKINCASTHRPLIEMFLKYLIIRPLASIDCNLNQTFERYWRENHMALNIGHRGTGNTYQLNGNVHRENTLYAFKKAHLHDADVVEFDVHLTKDGQAVIYHDFVLEFSLDSADNVEKLLTDYDVLVFPHERFNRLKLLAMGGVKHGNHIVIPLDAFTYDELRLARVLRFVSQSAGCGQNCDSHFQEQLPFPLLSDLFNPDIVYLPEKLGFYIEVKWPQQDTRRRWQENSFKPCFDRNLFVDTILEVVFQGAGKRRIVFQSFDADICVMLRFKQNRYPVLLLLMDTERPVQFLDQRVNSLENGCYLAYIMEFFGLNMHATSLLKQPLILGLIRDLHMQGNSYSDGNNDEANRQKLKRYGVVGLTYDRIDQMNQIGEPLLGNVCCIDSMATRNFILKLEIDERIRKCARH